MHVADHISALRRDGQRLAEAAEAAGLHAPVPSCPKWQVRDLLRHIGEVHRWAGAFVADAKPSAQSDDDEPIVIPGDEELLAWYRDGHSTVVQILNDADPDVTCWTFLPAPSPLAFWARRQAHETAIHRVDAELAVPDVTTCEPAFAADGIDELLTGFLARRGGKLLADPSVGLGVHATDTGDAWSVRVQPDGRVVTAGSLEGDCVVSGPANDLYLLLWNRGGVDGLEVKGDPAVLDLWQAKATISWG